MKPSHRVAMNTGIVYARMALTVGLSLYATRVTLEALGVMDFGIFQVVGGAIALLAFLRGTLAAATQRFLSYTQGSGDQLRLHQIFHISQRLHRWLALGVLVCLEVGGILLFQHVFQMPAERLQAAQWVYQAACLSTVVSVLSVPYDASLNAHEHMAVMALTDTFEALAKVGIALYLVHTGFDRLITYGVLMMAATLVSALVRVAYCRRTYPECRPGAPLQMDRVLLREMTAFGGWSFLSSVTSLVNGYGIGLVLNAFFGVTVNAAQGVANQISGQLGAFALTLLKAVSPLIDKSEGAGDRDRMLRVTFVASKVAFFLLAIVAVPVMLEMPWLFDHWLKVVPPFAIVFCELLLARSLVEQWFVPMISAIRAVGDIRRYEVIFSLVTLAPLPVSYLLFDQGLAPTAVYVVNLGYALVLVWVVGQSLGRSAGFPLSRLLAQVVLRCALAMVAALLPAVLLRLGLAQGVIRVALVALTWGVGFSVAFWYLGFTVDERLRAHQEVATLFRALQRRWWRAGQHVQSPRH
jgi:Na+-driven multidrug efflux pump